MGMLFFIFEFPNGILFLKTILLFCKPCFEIYFKTCCRTVSYVGVRACALKYRIDNINIGH